jgi:hypothetical protein
MTPVEGDRPNSEIWTLGSQVQPQRLSPEPAGRL